MRYACFVSLCFRVFHLDNHCSWEHQRRFCYPLGRFERIKTVLMGTNRPHTCIPGLVWQKKARRFSQFELKVGDLGFPIHFVCVSAALYHRGHAAAIFSPEVNTVHSCVHGSVCSLGFNFTDWFAPFFSVRILTRKVASAEPL